MIDSTSWGKALEIAREARGVTAKAIAMDLHVSNSAYYRLERGRIDITIGKADAICEILNWDLVSWKALAKEIYEKRRT